ncbi:hypothetical protein WDZ11_00930 [Roseomonas mucosa]|jgi:hypothetical protein|uniref:hypothetical protein n=1 Tax=Roseomonas mucosa TaxID=207340 RepID=UPI0028CE353E|nr:hypothetical protein [Roseomonas sp. DSM 102946]
MSAALNLHTTAQQRPTDRRRTPRHRSRGIGTTTGEAISNTSSAGPQGPDGRLLELGRQIDRIYREHEEITERMAGVKSTTSENVELEEWSDRLVHEESRVVEEMANLTARTPEGLRVKAMVALITWEKLADDRYHCRTPHDRLKLDVLRFVAGI